MSLMADTQRRESIKLIVFFSTGLFFFDGRFRPVPLTTTFVGVKSAKQQQVNDMDEICYEKVYTKWQTYNAIFGLAGFM
jgi:hypothetical protein